MKTASRVFPIIAAAAIAVAILTSGTAAAKTKKVYLDAHGCVKSSQKWCVHQRLCIDKTAACKKITPVKRCTPKKCSDGREFPTCSAQGYPINYFVDPCRKLNSSSSSIPCVGCDRDTHSCIGSAGYSWCAAKSKCLRIWEEPCQ